MKKFAVCFMLLTFSCGSEGFPRQAEDDNELREEISLLKEELRENRKEIRENQKEIRLLKETTLAQEEMLLQRRADVHRASANDGQKVPFNHVITNEGAAYDTQANEFLAPVAGTYVFIFTVGGSNSNTCHLSLYKNEEADSYVEAFGNLGSSGLKIGTNAVVLQLVPGDKISLRPASSCRLRGNTYKHSTFTGFLLM